MNIKRLALLTFAATTLATAAFADGGHGGFLKSADLNKDGTIDQTEFQTTRDKWFADLDSNKDGFVSADELKVFGDKMHAEWAKKHGDEAANKPDADQPGRADRDVPGCHAEQLRGALGRAVGVGETLPPGTGIRAGRVQHDGVEAPVGHGLARPDHGGGLDPVGREHRGRGELRSVVAHDRHVPLAGGLQPGGHSGGAEALRRRDPCSGDHSSSTRPG